MKKKRQIPRRNFLRGLGTAMALPLLDSLLPARLAGGRAAFAAAAAGPAAAAAEGPRLNRMAFLYVPNGIHMEDWTPAKVGGEFELPATLRPLEAFKDDLLVLSGLTQDKARPNGDGPGDHARAAAAFLTGCQPFKTHGADIRVGISVDQVAAQKVGSLTRFPSLELGCDRGPQSGNCDSGYSCAYSANISWRSESTPLAKEIDPRLVFERLFSNEVKGEVDENRARRERYQKSILDFVLDDASQLKSRLGLEDRRKVDEYLAGVRELEARLERTEKSAREETPALSKPDGIPKEYKDHLRLMCDLIVLAFQADMTRVVTFMLANEGSNRSYRFIEVREGHHDLSHHGGDKEKQSKIARINNFHMDQLGYLLGRLKGIKEGDGTLLDHAMIVYGSGIGDGNRHNHDELPVLLAGRGAGTISTGRHIRYPRNTPLNNLYLSMLDRIDSRTETLGDSTGRLPHLYGPTRSF